MKIFLFLTWVVVTVSAVSNENVYRVNGLLDRENNKSCVENAIPPVEFFLYTQSNPKDATKIFFTNKSIAESNFNSSNPTRFVIHGFLVGYKNLLHIRDAWLSQGDYNIIAVDWKCARPTLAQDKFELILQYLKIKKLVGPTGKKIGTFIEFLHKNHGMSLETLHVIGHSLGAHVAGYAGKNIISGKIHTIVGLDPAQYDFYFTKNDTRLHENDAFYVETIHTDTKYFGFSESIGKAAFYPNGGSNQPGCTVGIYESCSHGRAHIYYAMAVEFNNFTSYKCASYKEAAIRNCDSTPSVVRMGARESTNSYDVSGVYYVPINKDFPTDMDKVIKGNKEIIFK